MLRRNDSPQSQSEPKYKLEYTRLALKGLRSLEASRRELIKTIIDSLCIDPQPQESRGVVGAPSNERLTHRYIRSGDYRVIYSIADTGEIVILGVGHRKDIYRKVKYRNRKVL